VNSNERTASISKRCGEAIGAVVCNPEVGGRKPPMSCKTKIHCVNSESTNMFTLFETIAMHTTQYLAFYIYNNYARRIKSVTLCHMGSFMSRLVTSSRYGGTRLSNSNSVSGCGVKAYLPIAAGTLEHIAVPFLHRRFKNKKVGNWSTQRPMRLTPFNAF